MLALSLAACRPVSPKPAQAPKAPTPAVQQPPQQVVQPAAKEPPDTDAGRGFLCDTLYENYKSDAVLWHDRFAGKYVTLRLGSPETVGHDRKGYHVVQIVQQGLRSEGMRIYLREADARRLSRINHGEEKVPEGKCVGLRVLVALDGFALSDGQIAFLDRPR